MKLNILSTSILALTFLSCGEQEQQSAQVKDIGLVTYKYGEGRNTYNFQKSGNIITRTHCKHGQPISINYCNEHPQTLEISSLYETLKERHCEGVTIIQTERVSAKIIEINNKIERYEKILSEYKKIDNVDLQPQIKEAQDMLQKLKRELQGQIAFKKRIDQRADIAKFEKYIENPDLTLDVSVDQAYIEEEKKKEFENYQAFAKCLNQKFRRY